MNEGLRQLSNGKFHQKMNSDRTIPHNEMVKKQLFDMTNRGEITKLVRDYLILDTPRTPEFYMLPKIHKDTTPPPGRPIISANSSPTERISAFVDHFLRPNVTKGKSYLKDTSDFLKKLQTIRDINEDSLLVSLDVTSLYTNIPNEEGIEATYWALLNHRGMVNNPSNMSLVELLSLVLTLNNFKFNEEHFLQIGRTAMGTRLAPSFANIYMNHFENAHVYSYQLQPKAWYRYIDDIFMVWNHGIDELNTFVNHLNNTCDSISFSMEVSKV